MHSFYFALLNLLIVLLGYVLIKEKMIWQSCVMLISGIIIVDFIFLDDNAVIRMLSLIATTFTGMKVIAVAETYKGKVLSLRFIQWLAFAVGWAGMRAQPFETLGAKPLANAWPMVWFGVSRIIIGLLLILLAHGIVLLPVNAYLIYIVASVVLLIAFSLILHFGLLSISAGMWRLAGVNTYYLFRQPAKALSLTEFWSKRWNIAFSEMTSITIFRPLKNKIGEVAAMILAFAFSGLLHELALSVPVSSGYGLPMMYFIIQGVLILAEKIIMRRQNSFLHNKTISRLWTFFWVVSPAPLLFHPEFIRQIVWPLAGLGK